MAQTVSPILVPQLWKSQLFCDPPQFLEPRGASGAREAWVYCEPLCNLQSPEFLRFPSKKLEETTEESVLSVAVFTQWFQTLFKLQQQNMFLKQNPHIQHRCFRKQTAMGDTGEMRGLFDFLSPASPEGPSRPKASGWSRSLESTGWGDLQSLLRISGSAPGSCEPWSLWNSLRGSCATHSLLSLTPSLPGTPSHPLLPPVSKDAATSAVLPPEALCRP